MVGWMSYGSQRSETGVRSRSWSRRMAAFSWALGRFRVFLGMGEPPLEIVAYSSGPFFPFRLKQNISYVRNSLCPLVLVGMPGGIPPRDWLRMVSPELPVWCPRNSLVSPELPLRVRKGYVRNREMSEISIYFLFGTLGM